MRILRDVWNVISESGDLILLAGLVLLGLKLAAVYFAD